MVRTYAPALRQLIDPPWGVSRSTFLRRHLSVVASLALLDSCLPAGADPVAAETDLAARGFSDDIVWDDISNPTVVAFAPDGGCLRRPKSGKIWGTPTSWTRPRPWSPTSADDVYNYWDRGLLGLHDRPEVPVERPYLYALYAYNHELGKTGTGPRTTFRAGVLAG